MGIVLTNEDNVQYLAFLDLATNKSEVLKAEAGLDINGFDWSNDDEILFNVIKDGSYAYGLYRAELGNLRGHTAFLNFDATTLVGIPKGRPDRAIVYIRQSARGYNASGRLIELNTRHDATPGKKHIPSAMELKAYAIPGGNGVVSDWIALHNGELGYAITYKDLRQTLHRYDHAKDAWNQTDLDLETYNIAGVDPDGYSLWVSHYEAPRGFILRKYDALTGSFSEPVWQDPVYDPGSGSLFFSKKTNQLLGFNYYQRRLFSHWMEESFASAHAALQQRSPEADVALIDFDESEQKLLFKITGSQEPGRIVLLDLARKEIIPISSNASWLRGRTLFPARPVNFKSRDGLDLEGYLTLPADADAQHKAPLVILPHSNLWKRDTLAFSPTVQFLASRGYAVLQPNYRGSSGYMPAISRDGRYNVLLRHQDITDATRATARLEMIDGSRMAIMGNGFAAYFALSGVAFEPGLYRCAVADDGIYDWNKFLRDSANSRQPRQSEFFRDQLRATEKEGVNLKKISISSRAETIQAPVLLSYEKSEKVFTQSLILRAALEKHDRPHEIFLSNFYGQGQEHIKNRTEYLARLEAFLKKNL